MKVLAYVWEVFYLVEMVCYLLLFFKTCYIEENWYDKIIYM